MDISIFRLAFCQHLQYSLFVYYLSFPQVDEKTEGEPGWLYGSFQGQLGWFPCNYVEKVAENEKPLSPKKALLPPTVSLPAASVPAE